MVPESLSGVERALWRIAELGARCGRRAGGADRPALWQELEQLITITGGELSTGPAAADTPTAVDQLRSLERRLRTARGERDHERTRAADAEAATDGVRRERDRAVRKAAAAATAARAARAAVRAACARAEQAEADGARATAMFDAERARCLDLEGALATALAERDAAIVASASFTADIESAVSLLAARAEGAVAVPSPSGPTRPGAEVEDAISLLAARAEGAVGVLPRVTPGRSPRPAPRGRTGRRAGPPGSHS